MALVDVGEAAARAEDSVSSPIVCGRSPEDCSEPVSDDAAIETSICWGSTSLPPVVGVCMLLAPLRTDCAVSVTADCVTDELCESSAFTRDVVPNPVRAKSISIDPGGDAATAAASFLKKLKRVGYACALLMASIPKPNVLPNVDTSDLSLRGVFSMLRRRAARRNT